MADFWFETYYTRGYIVPCMMYDYIIIIIPMKAPGTLKVLYAPGYKHCMA